MHRHHTPTSLAPRTRLLMTLVLTGSIMLIELLGGLFSGSLALLADAGHMLTDFLALLLAFAAMILAQRPADRHLTYGYRRLEILAALANGVALIVISGSIVYEAILRLASPSPVDFRIMVPVATAGLVANLGGLWLLGAHEHNLNMRGAFLHLLGDTISSVGVIVAALLMAVTGWHRLDAVISLLIAAVIVVTTSSLLREVLGVLLEAAPRHLDMRRVQDSITGTSGIAAVHDLHVWSITSGLLALSAHVVTKDRAQDCHALRARVSEMLAHEYDITHVTLQMEPPGEGAHGCCLAGTRDH